MKKYLTPLALVITLAIQAQVGIGTDNPQSDLHIAGAMLVQDTFQTGSITATTSLDEDFKLIARATNSTPPGELKVLDVDALDVAPVNIIDYTFNNIALDNITDLDLQYDESKYIVGVANFRYEGDAVKKVIGGATKSIGNFVVQTFTSGGTWHLEIRNRSLDLNVGDSVTYHATLVIYNKAFYRNLDPIATDLGGSNTGTASSVPVLE